MQNRVEIIVGIFVLVALGIFAYMGFQVGAFRFDRMRYHSYQMTFKDVSGLSRKAPVKIAGVTVGWIESISLQTGSQTRASTLFMIHRDYVLHSDAHAIIRQDGLLGPKYVEIVPGDPLLPRLEPGCLLAGPCREPQSVDEIFNNMSRITGNIEEVSRSLKNAIGGVEGGEQLKTILQNISVAAQKIASFSDAIDRSIAHNEGNLDSLFNIGTNVQRLSDRIDRAIFPVIEHDLNKVTSVIDSLNETSGQIRDSFKSISSIAEKIDQGKGAVGKLINDDETYNDLKFAAKGLKNYVAHGDMLQIIFDSHVEGMYRPGEHYAFEDGKGYFDIRIHPNEDHFYLLELAASERGYRNQHEKFYEFACDDRLVDPSSSELPDFARYWWQYRRCKTTWDRYTWRVGFQFGKMYSNFAFRFGLFDGGFAGAAVDLDIPFETDKFRWLMSVEAYDLHGWNRENDRNPHLKWLNKVYMLHNLYVVFGADDFVSKKNANLFFGAGLRFGDDDIKYILPSLGSIFSG